MDVNVNCCCCDCDSHSGCWGTSAGIPHKSRSDQIQCLGHGWSREVRWSARWILYPGWVLRDSFLSLYFHFNFEWGWYWL